MELDRLGRALGERSIVGEDGEDAIQVVKSAGRVLQILELFDVLKRETVVSEVSDLLDLPQSSTSTLLRSLVAMGYLSYNPETRAFASTTRVALLGSWVNGTMLSDGPLIRLLQRLNAQTGQAVVLAVRNQVWSQYIHVVQAISPVRMYVVKGSRRPLVRSGTGLTFLTDLPDNEIKRIATRHNAETPHAHERVCLATLIDQVKAVRDNGYAFNHDTVTAGGGAIAVKLPRLENGEQFSVGIAASTKVLRANRDKYVLTLFEEIASHITRSTPVPAGAMQCN